MTHYGMNSFADPSQTLHLPFQIRFENALKEPLANKCKVLSDLINESLSLNTKEIQQRYVLLVEDIFSFQYNNVSYSRTEWKLKTLTNELSTYEFDVVFQFLKTTGPMFKLIGYLMNDLNNRYEFPINCLSLPTRIALEEGYVSNFYSSKILTSTSLSLNAFEFYLFHFAYFITKVDSTRLSSLADSGNENSNILYYQLLENYLEAFVPIPKASVNSEEAKNSNSTSESPSLWKSLSNTTTNILSLASPKAEPSFTIGNAGERNFLNITKLYGTGPNGSTPKSPVNSKMLTLTKFQQTLESNNSLADMLGTALFKCESVLNIFTEIWFNHLYCFTNYDEKHKINLNSTSFNVTVEHMKVIRIFIKHLHYFGNSTCKKTYELNSPFQSQLNSGGVVPSHLNDPLDEVKRNLWSSKYLIQKKLYQFLRISFDRWPNDSSFRVPLETWLSYIQPWRYVSLKGQSKGEDDSVSIDCAEWKRFISDNLFFYTVIFRQVINRMSKLLDLNSTTNSLLVYRVTKVFAQDHLSDCIKECEVNLLSGLDMSNNFNGHNSSSSLLSLPKHIYSSPSVSCKNLLMDMEPFPSEHVSIFSHSFRNQIIYLLLQIAKSLSALSEPMNGSHPSSNKSVDLVSSVCNFFSGDQSTTTTKSQNKDSAKVRNYLDSSIRNISAIFDISPQSIETILSNEKNSLYSSIHETSDANMSLSEIYENVDGVPKLSERARNMVINGTLKLNGAPNLAEGNPDTQPVRTFELSLLVKLALVISLVINRRCGHFFHKHYDNKSLLGLLLHTFLHPPVKYVTYVKSSNGFASQMVIEQLPPRVNLRFMASYEFLFYSLICTLVFTIFNLCNHLLLFTTISILSLVIYISVKTVCS